MKLFSEVPISSPDSKIKHQSKILTIGSCFATKMGERLVNHEFQTLINPFGTQFHPLAIEHTFNRIYAREHYTEHEIFEYNGLSFSWDHSSSFSNPNKNQMLTKLNDDIDKANAFLSKTDFFIFTLGTAWAYYLKRGDFYVSNCHKVPQKHFSKNLLSVEQIYHSVKNLIFKVKDVRPSAQIIFTISPVRHLRDGFRENNVSKGILHFTLHKILNDFSEVSYFPSYEIALDELRDYRFYAEDLAHLNDLGLNVVWEKFSQNYFSEETQDLIYQIEKIKKAVNHKPQNPDSVFHKKFLYDTLKKAQELQLKLHNNALQKEINILKNQLHVD